MPGSCVLSGSGLKNLRWPGKRCNTSALMHPVFGELAEYTETGQRYLEGLDDQVWHQHLIEVFWRRFYGKEVFLELWHEYIFFSVLENVWIVSELSLK